MKLSKEDTEILEIFKSYYSIVEQGRMLAILDLNFINLFCTAEYAALLQLQPQDIIGKRLCEIVVEKPNKYLESMERISQKHLQPFLEHRPPFIEGLCCFETIYGLGVFSFIITPLTEKLHKFELRVLHVSIVSDLSHILHQITKIGAYSIRVTSKELMPKRYMTSRILVELLEKEEIIVFLLTLGNSYKCIANILTRVYGINHSDTQIKSVVYNVIFDKFNVSSISELISAYINSAYSHVIPQKLILKLNFEGVLSLNYN